MHTAAMYKTRDAQVAACLYHVSGCMGFHALLHLPIVVFSGEDNEYRTPDLVYTTFLDPHRGFYCAVPYRFQP